MRPPLQSCRSYFARPRPTPSTFLSGVPEIGVRITEVATTTPGSATSRTSRRGRVGPTSRSSWASTPEASQTLLVGEGRAYSPGDEAPAARRDVARFVVRTVGPAPVEAEATAPPRIIQPHHVFRDEQGAALYVPTVAGSRVEQAGQP